MRIDIDKNRCSGHGRCYASTPSLFNSDDEGFGQELFRSVPETLRVEAAEAVHMCPEGAITLTEVGPKEQ